MRKFFRFCNEDYGEETYLWEVLPDDSLNFIKCGDYYHNKISENLDGFFEGLTYCGVEYEIITGDDYKISKLTDEFDEKFKYGLDNFSDDEVYEIYKLSIK